MSAITDLDSPNKSTLGDPAYRPPPKPTFKSLNEKMRVVDAGVLTTF